MAKIKLKNRKAGRIAYIEHTGPYDDIPFEDYYKKLYDWAKANKAKPGFKPLSNAAPGEEFENTYKALTEWINTNGYEWSGPPIEVYTKKPEVKDGKTYVFADIQAPIKKAQS